MNTILHRLEKLESRVEVKALTFDLIKLSPFVLKHLLTILERPGVICGNLPPFVASSGRGVAVLEALVKGEDVQQGEDAALELLWLTAINP